MNSFRVAAFSILAFVNIAAVNSAIAEVIPPVLVQREANKWPEPPAGKVVTLDDPTSTTFVLYLPEEIDFSADGATTLTVHFHGAAWFMQQEHARRGARYPLLVGNAPEGDIVFEGDIMQPGVMDSLMDQTIAEINNATARENARIGAFELSGFSAGYAGVRGILRQSKYEPRVMRVMLNDSMYVGDGPDSNPPDNRKPRKGEDGIGPFVDFARKAVDGEREMVVEFSTTPSIRSVGPMGCALAIMEAIGAEKIKVAPNSIPAARETADFQLIWRADKGNAHFWCYDTIEKPIHLAHVRNQSNMWQALAGKGSLESIPPVMTPRPIKPTEPPFETTSLNIGTTGTVELYVPANYKVPKDGGVELTVHFHGATWFVIQEHQKRGNGDPVVALELGQGSSVYRIPFEDPKRFGLLLNTVVDELKANGAPENTHIASVNITSFSAGYGAVREIVKSPEYVAVIKRIVLGDSSYASLDEEELKNGRRIVAQEHVEPYLDFARLAIKGEKTFLLTTSEIAPDTYAGTHEVARAITNALGVDIVPVKPGDVPSADADLPYPLKFRADASGYHWWGYGGQDAVVHMTLARHIADAWEALDQVGDK